MRQTKFSKEKEIDKPNLNLNFCYLKLFPITTGNMVLDRNSQKISDFCYFFKTNDCGIFFVSTFFFL